MNTPGGDQPTWAYELLDLDPATRHLIGTGGIAASSVALPVVSSVEVSTPLPACPSLRGQPCRATPPIANVVAIGPTAPPATPAPTAPGFTG